MGNRDIEILISARDTAAAKLKLIDDEMKKLGRSAAEAHAKGTPPDGKSLTSDKYLGQMAEGMAKAMIAAKGLQAAFEGIGAVADVARGKMSIGDAFDNFIESAPLVGAMAKAERQMMEKLWGGRTTEEIKAADAREKAAVQHLGELQKELGLAQALTEADKQRLKVELDFQDQLVKAQGIEDPNVQAATEATLRAIRIAQNKALDEADAKSKVDAEKKVTEELQKQAKLQEEALTADDARVQRMREERAAAFRKEVDRQDELSKLAAEAAASQLLLKGETLKAEEVKIHESYRKRIEDAQAAADQETLARLKAAEEGEIAVARMNDAKAHEKTVRNAASTAGAAMDSQTMLYTAGMLGGNTAGGLDSKRNALLEKQLDVATKQLAALQAMRGGPPTKVVDRV